MKTPKEKAQELVEEFIDFAYDGYSDNQSVKEVNETNFRNAKQCAKISVNEILKAIDWHEFETPNKQIEYWNEVLKEIDNL